MEPIAYQSMSELEGQHWWFAGRRQILDHALKCLEQTEPMQILEVGCGTGGNLEMLSAYGQVCGIEPDPVARQLSAARGIAEVVDGRLPNELDFGDRRFDLLAAFDVLEHLEQDKESLHELVGLLNPGAKAILTVPAYPKLWSAHDEVHHHKRRYTKRGFESLIEGAGLEIVQLSHFNTLLFLPAALARMASKMKSPAPGESPSMETMPPQRLNQVLGAIFASERHLLNHVSLPFGLSLLAVAQRPGSER